MERKLYRSESNRMIAGVCGGLGDYLNIDPVIVRIFFVLLALGGNGIGVLVYLLLWITVPSENLPLETNLQDTVRNGTEEIAERTLEMGNEFRRIVRDPNPKASLFIGITLVFLGAFYLVQNLHLPWLDWFNFHNIWPLLLIFGGMALLIRYLRKD